MYDAKDTPTPMTLHPWKLHHLLIIYWDNILELDSETTAG